MAGKTLKATIELAAKLDGSMQSSFSKAGKMIDDLEGKAKRADITPKITKGGLSGTERVLNSMSRKIRSFGQGITRAGQSIQHLGSKLTPISLAAQGAIASSVKMASDFEDSMAKVNTIAGLSGTKLSALSKDLLNVSSDTGKSASEIAEAAYQSLSASVPTDQVAKFTKIAANLGKTGFTDTASAVDVLSTAINAYGLKTSEASKLSDMLIQTQNRGKTTVSELATQMGNVIPTASALGVNMANLATGYVQLTKQGINTATTTTELRAIFNELSKSGSGVDKILQKQTKKSFTELMSSGKSLGDVMQILSDSVKGNKTEFKNLWSNSRAGAGALALLNAGSKDFNRQLKDMNASTGNTADALNKLKTPGAQARKSINALKNSSIELGQTFMDAAAPTISKVSSEVSKLTKRFSALPEEEKKNIAKITSLTAVAGPAAVAVGKIVSATGRMITKTGDAIGKVSDLIGKLRKLKTASDAASQGAGILSGASSGAGIVIGGVGAAVVGLSVVMLANRRHFQASSSAVSKLTDKYDEAGKKTKSLVSSTEKQISASKSSVSSIRSNSRVASNLAEKIKSLSSVENKSASQKKKLKAEVAALNRVVPGLNLSYDEEKDKLSKTNKEISKNIRLIKQQEIAKQAGKNASGLRSKQASLMQQQATNEINIEDQSSKVEAIRKKQAAALAKYNKLYNDPTASDTEKNDAMKKVSKYTSLLNKGEKSLDSYKSKQASLNKELSKVEKAIDLNSFTSVLAQAKAAGKKVPSELSAGIKSTMSILPTTEKELTRTLKYKTVIEKAKDAGVKIPENLSKKMLSGKTTVKKAETQIGNVITFDKASKKAEKAGVKIPKSLSSGVSSGKISASKATARLNGLISFSKAEKKAKQAGVKIPKNLSAGVKSGKTSATKAARQLSNLVNFEKAVKKARKDGAKIPKSLVSAVRSGKVSVTKASSMIAKASTSKLDRSKEAKSKGTKTNTAYSRGVGNTSKPKAAGQKAANAGVKPFNSVPGRVSKALRGLGSKIASAFSFKVPKIKIPHFSLSGKFDLKSGSIPHIGVSWYKKGGIMTRPTVFGAAGNQLLAGGEAGPEGIIPLDKLWKNMDRAVTNSVSNVYNYGSSDKDNTNVINNYYTTSVTSTADRLNDYSHSNTYNSRTNSDNSQTNYSTSNSKRNISFSALNKKNVSAVNSASTIVNRAADLAESTANLYTASVTSTADSSPLKKPASVILSDRTLAVPESATKIKKETDLKKQLISLSKKGPENHYSTVKNVFSSIFGQPGSGQNTSVFNHSLTHISSSADKIRDSSLEPLKTSSGQSAAAVIREGAQSRSARSPESRTSLASVSNARSHSTNRSVSISGITFAPNITIAGNAAKQDIMDALREVEDEFCDYLSQLTADEEDAQYA